MIRNIVFDMGMVLMDFFPRELCKTTAPDEATAAQLYHAIFENPDWIGLDKGTVTEAELTQIAMAMLPAALHPYVQSIMGGLPTNVLRPLPGMPDLVDWVFASGYRVYLLSNAGRNVSENREIIPQIDRFNGVMFSVEEKVIKPNPEIYQRLTSRYGLLPQECLFVDDNEKNVLAAQAEGWQGFHFSGDAAKLRRHIEGLQ